MKKVIAILLSVMMIVSTSAVAVNAEEIKNIFDTKLQEQRVEEVLDLEASSEVIEDESALSDVASDEKSEKGAGENFTIEEVTYSADLPKTIKNGNIYLTHTKSARLSIRFDVHASASATNGTLVVPLDDVFDTSKALVSSTASDSYFVNFKYRVGGGAETVATVHNGKIAGIDGTNKHLEIPITSPSTAETNLNCYVYADFNDKFRALVPNDNIMAIPGYYMVENGSVVSTSATPLYLGHETLLEEKRGGFSYNDPIKEPEYLDEDKKDLTYYIFKGYEDQSFSPYNYFSLDTDGLFSNSQNIAVEDTDYPLVVEITIPKGIEIISHTPKNPSDPSSYSKTGSMNTGYTITEKYKTGIGSPTSNYSGDDPARYREFRYLFNSVYYNVPSNSTLKGGDRVIVKYKITAYTKDGVEVTEREYKLTILDPVQDLNDEAFSFNDPARNLTNRITLDLSAPTIVSTQTVYSDGLTNEGVLPIKGFELSWINDPTLPVNIKTITNFFNCSADFDIYITKGNTTRSVSRTDINFNKSMNIGTEASSDANYIKLETGEWISKIVAKPYYKEGSTKVYGIEGKNSSIAYSDDRDPIKLTYATPVDNKNMATGLPVNDGDKSHVTYELRYEPHYTINGENKVDIVGDNDSSGYIKAEGEDVFYIVGKAYHNAYIQSKGSYATINPLSGSETKALESVMYLSNTKQAQSQYVQGLASCIWETPIVVAELPVGVKFNTNSSKVTSTGTNKYRIVEGTKTVDVEILKEVNGKQVCRFTVDIRNNAGAKTGVPRYDNYSYSDGSRSVSVTIPFIADSRVIGGYQKATLYTSDASGREFGVIQNRCSFKPEAVASYVLDVNDYDGDGSTTDYVGKFENVGLFNVSASYQVDCKTQYKVGSQWRDATNEPISAIIGGETDFRVIITNAGNCIITNLNIQDTFPNFYTGGSTYVDNSLEIAVLDEEGNVVQIVSDATISGTTVLSIVHKTLELYPGYSIRLTGKFKVREDARPQYTANNTVKVTATYDGGTKTSNFTQPYISEKADTNVHIKVFLDMNGDGLYTEGVDRALSSASVKTEMTSSDENKFSDTKTLTNSMDINYQSCEFGEYKVVVSSAKDTFGYPLDDTTKPFEITLADARDGVQVEVLVPVKPINYLVHYNKNATDATGRMSDQQFKFGVAQSLTANAFARTGYTFGSWNTKADGTGTSYTDKQSVTDLVTLPTDEITLYAQWTPITYNIKFVPNGGEWAGTTDETTVTATYDKAYDLTANPTREGYTFTGWKLTYDSPNYVNYSTSATKADGAYYMLSGSKTGLANGDTAFGVVSNNNYSLFNLCKIADATAILTAQWSLNVYTVTYDGVEGFYNNKHSYSVNASYGELVTIDENKFENDGFAFVGWNTEKDGTGTDYDELDTFTMPSRDVILYAQWEKSAFDIIYVGNGGATADGETEKVYSYALNSYPFIKDCMFDREGYTFVGWGLSADSKVPEYDKDNVYLDGVTLTLYAIWLEGDNGEVMDTSDTDTTPDTSTESDDTSTDKPTDSDEPIPDKPLYGDVNCDGFVNMEDVTALQKIMAKLTTHENYGEMSIINSDCDHNDTINMVDVTMIQKFLAKLIPDLDP
ncbi:MAG: InlB B-repeat-containing protein [Clostridia bacterium]|nr:InlB B-repeat-containing protein [Clostridia bacterium]